MTTSPVTDTIPDRIPDPEEQPTLSVPEAGWLAFRLAPSASYDMAKRGDLPVIRLGRNRMRVPTAALRRMLGLDDQPRPAA